MGEAGKLFKTEWEIRRRVFAGGVEPSLRPEAWGFLFGVYPWDSAHADRLRIIKQKHDEYAKRTADWMENASGLVDQRLLMSINHYHDPDAASVQGSEELDAITSAKLDPRDEAVRELSLELRKTLRTVQAELCFLRFRNHAIRLDAYDPPRCSLDSVSSDASGTSVWTVAEVPLSRRHHTS
ncbi:hypothetical protein BJ742DRAFT_353981 [Cladochytrium replicatum]|nr:hypothetical protein BJ742DRAFT_353981 [Cladochytrium replicatum]